jgi:hypothetical protein
MTESPDKNEIKKIHGILIVLIYTNFIAGIILGIIGFYIPSITYFVQMNFFDGSKIQKFLDFSNSFLEWGQAGSSIVLGIWTILTIESTQFKHRIHHGKRIKRKIPPDKLFYSSSTPQNGAAELTLMIIAAIVNILNTPGIRSIIITTFNQTESDLLLVILSGLDVIGVICYFLYWSFLGKIYSSYKIMKKATTWIRVGNSNSLLRTFTLFLLRLNALTTCYSKPFLPDFMLSIHFIYPSILIYSLGILVFKSIGYRLLTEQRNVRR